MNWLVLHRATDRITIGAVLVVVAAALGIGVTLAASQLSLGITPTSLPLRSPVPAASSPP